MKWRFTVWQCATPCDAADCGSMPRILTWAMHFRGRERPTPNPLDVLPDFENLAYAIANKPTGSHVDAWDKLREAERRLVMYKWVEQHNDPATPHHRVLLDDSVSAFLLTFEATIQFLKDQFKRTGTPQQRFDAWFAGRPQNDVCLKGLRALRHLEAHVERRRVPRTVLKTLAAYVRVGRGRSRSRDRQNGNVGCLWQLPKLNPADIAKLDRSPLSVADLQAWNALREADDAKALFERGLLSLKSILDQAETCVTASCGNPAGWP